MSDEPESEWETIDLNHCYLLFPLIVKKLIKLLKVKGGRRIVVYLLTTRPPCPRPADPTPKISPPDIPVKFLPSLSTSTPRSFHNHYPTPTKQNKQEKPEEQRVSKCQSRRKLRSVSTPSFLFLARFVEWSGVGGGNLPLPLRFTLNALIVRVCLAK